MLHRRRSVSQLMAVVVIVAIMLSIGAFMFAWTLGIIKISSERHDVQITYAKLSYDVQSSSWVLSLNIKNLGTVPISVVGATIYTDSGPVSSSVGSKKKFYVIWISGIGGWWMSPSDFYQGIMDALSQMQDAQVIRITTLSDLDNLIRNPEDGIILINAHGECLPRPPSWPNWQSYFLAIADNVKRRGWIFVTAIAYPLYYTQYEVIGSGGLNTFLSSIGASANAWGSTSHSPTQEGIEALSIFGYSPADPLSGTRTIRWYNIQPYVAFYNEVGGRYIAAAVKMDNGFYLNFGGMSISYRWAGRYSAAFSYWLANKLQVPTGKSMNLKITDLSVTTGKTYTVVINISWIDGSTKEYQISVQAIKI